VILPAAMIRPLASVVMTTSAVRAASRTRQAYGCPGQVSVQQVDRTKPVEGRSLRPVLGCCHLESGEILLLLHGPSMTTVEIVVGSPPW
jgi:hypothetical protein